MLTCICVVVCVCVCVCAIMSLCVSLNHGVHVCACVCMCVYRLQLGHNLPDAKGNRYCINLVSVAGSPGDCAAPTSNL
jgi:hypothetical protein